MTTTKKILVIFLQKLIFSMTLELYGESSYCQSCGFYRIGRCIIGVVCDILIYLSFQGAYNG